MCACVIAEIEKNGTTGRRCPFSILTSHFEGERDKEIIIYTFFSNEMQHFLFCMIRTRRTNHCTYMRVYEHCYISDFSASSLCSIRSFIFLLLLLLLHFLLLLAKMVQLIEHFSVIFSLQNHTGKSYLKPALILTISSWQ